MDENTNTPIEMIIVGDPAAQGSKRTWAAKRKDGTYTGKTVMVEQSKAKLDPWRAAVSLQARQQWRGRPPVSGAVVLGLVIALQRGKTVRRPYPSVAPDLDKLARAVGDALTTAGVYADDALVVRYSTLAKVYAGGPYFDGCPELDRPGCWISVRSLDAVIPQPRIAERYGRPTAKDLDAVRSAAAGAPERLWALDGYLD